MCAPVNIISRKLQQTFSHWHGRSPRVLECDRDQMDKDGDFLDMKVTDSEKGAPRTGLAIWLQDHQTAPTFASPAPKNPDLHTAKTSAMGLNTGREKQSFQELHHPLIFHLSFSKSLIISGKFHSDHFLLLAPHYCPVHPVDHFWGTLMSLRLFTIIEKYLTLNVSFSD